MLQSNCEISHNMKYINNNNNIEHTHIYVKTVWNIKIRNKVKAYILYERNIKRRMKSNA